MTTDLRRPEESRGPRMMSHPAAPDWVAHERRDPEQALGLANQLGLPLPMAHALVNRGVGDAARVQRFLSPTLEDLHDPYLLLDVDRAVDRIRTAIDRGEGILVHGDYDVDGITSTFLLYSALRDLGAKAEYRIPHRTRDGYGLSRDAMEDARRRGCGLVITVDCGVTAIEAVERGVELGLDTLITHHHVPPAGLPPAPAGENPLRPGCAYPFNSLARVGVAFKLDGA